MTHLLIFGGGITLCAAIALYAQHRDYCNKMAAMKRKYCVFTPDNSNNKISI